MKPIAICINILDRQRNIEQNIPKLEDYLEENNLPFEYVDCYKYDIINNLDKYSALIWHYSNFANADLMEAQNILDIAEKKGIKTYPNHNTGWHFDDKIAEMYAFQSVNAPIPDSWVFYEKDKCIDWLKNEAKYPLVAKLRRGSGANNVYLLKNFKKAKKYAKRMFSRGFSPAQSLLYKTYSKVQSTRDWAVFVKRFKQIPNFLKARIYGKGMPVEKGYCYFQEFIENEGFDIKVIVVNEKCTFLERKTRKGSFKASGGGDIIYDKSMVSTQVIISAFETAEKLNMQCVGFDYVVDSKTNKGKIIEMCHGFDLEAAYNCGGYWTRDLVWHDEPVNAKIEILKQLIKDID